MAGISPTQRSLAYLRNLGYKAFVVEKVLPYSYRKIDFAGFADILAFKPGIPGVLAVQTTSSSNISAHRRKYEDDKVISGNIEDWLAAENKFDLHGWSKRGARGKRKIWGVTVTSYNNKDGG